MKKIITILVTLTLLLSFVHNASANIYELDRKLNIDSLELTSFMDGIIEAIMTERHIAGATLCIIKDGKALVKKGYGYADVDRKIKVDPDNTLFRIGSISKLFTWIALLQQVEKGIYDLDTDINEYLTAFKIPQTFDKPVTIRSLLSHTPGFEDKLLYLFVKTPKEMKTLEEIFKSQMPKRVRPPLEYAAYSNHGTGLAQYLVELSSGMRFEEYAEKYLFEPLGLENTTFRQPLPANLRNQMSKGYAFENGIMQEKYFEYVPMAGAGATSSSAGDMEKFMNALLQSTCKDTLCLLNNDTYNLMVEPVLLHADGMNPALHGFMDSSKNGVRIVGHGGDTFWFHSLLALIPEYNIGFFVSFNSLSGGSAYSEAFKHFMDRYLPDDRDLFEVAKFDNDYLQKFAGQYKSNRYPHSDIFKLLSVLNPLNITTDNDMLRIDGYTEKATFWTSIDSLTFRNINSNELIAFELNDEKSKAEKLFFGNYSIIAFERIDGFNNIKLHLFILLISLAVIIYIIVFWPYIALIRYKHQRILPAPQLIPFPAKLVAWICAACFVIFYLLILFSTSGSGQELIMRLPLGLKIAMFFPFLSMPFFVLMILQAIILWKMKDVKWRSRLFYYIAILSFLAFYWQLYYWNFLGWNY